MKIKRMLKKCWYRVRDAFIWLIVGLLAILWFGSLFVAVPTIVILGAVKLIMMVIGG